MGAAVFILIYDYAEAFGLRHAPEHDFSLTLLNAILGGLIVFLSSYFILMLYTRTREREVYEESERKFRTVSRATQDGVVMLDSRTRILFWNEACEKIFGFSEKEVIAKKLRSVIDHQLVTQTPSGLDAPGGGPAETKVLELIAKRKNGSSFPIELSMSGVKTGGEWQTVGIIRDITERRKVEEELRAAYSRIQEARAQLAKIGAMDMVGKMASGVAHDVKNPLTVILQSAEYLSEMIETADPTIVETLNRITDAVGRADDVINDLFDVASLSKLDLSTRQLNGIIETALTATAFQRSRQKIRLVKELDASLPPLNLDEAKIRRVFENLFTNSIHAMPQGGDLLIKTYVSGPRASEKNPAIVVEVADTGTGIPEDFLKKVFEPFFTTRADHGGTGLGLSTVKSIIEMHQGEISLKNRPAGGAVATIVFRGGQ